MDAILVISTIGVVTSWMLYKYFFPFISPYLPNESEFLEMETFYDADDNPEWFAQMRHDQGDMSHAFRVHQGVSVDNIYLNIDRIEETPSVVRRIRIS